MYLTHSVLSYSEEIKLFDHIQYPQYVHFITDGGLRTSAGISTLPEQLILSTLNKSNTREVIKNLTNKINKVGFILAAGNTVWGGHFVNIKYSKKYPTNKIIPLSNTQIIAGKIANQLGTFDYIGTDATSCISGHSAWYMAKTLIDIKRLDAVVVIAVENSISEENLAMFAELNISKKLEEENTDIQKFRLGQGCHIGVFESSSCYKKTNNSPLAKIINIHTASEVCNTPLGISEDGNGYRKVLEKVNNGRIDFIKTHGTFTVNNSIEEKVIRSLFGEIPLVNYKLRIGHTMGASTAVETALAIKEHTGKFISLGAGMGNVYSAANVEILK